MAAPLVIDGKDHISGRLAGVVAKHLFNGRKVVVVRAEDIVVNDYRFNHHKYARFLNKTTDTKPRRGPFHQRAPNEMFKRAVRGMIPYKTTRGETAFSHLEACVGVPPPYENTTRLVVPGRTGARTATARSKQRTNSSARTPSASSTTTLSKSPDCTFLCLKQRCLSRRCRRLGSGPRAEPSKFVCQC
jgi:ribosomal protein uL13